MRIEQKLREKIEKQVDTEWKKRAVRRVWPWDDGYLNGAELLLPLLVDAYESLLAQWNSRTRGYPTYKEWEENEIKIKQAIEKIEKFVEPQSEDEMTDKKITFTPYEKRVLELKQDFEVSDEAAFVLRSCIDHFPFILEIADHGFNHDAAAAILIREAKTIQAEAECERKIQELSK